MASDLNKVILIGRLTKDPELNSTSGGSSVVNISLASNRTYVMNDEKKKKVSFFHCTAWSKIGENIAKHCRKGHRIAIEGRLQQKSWEDDNGIIRYGIEIVIESFQFLQPKEESNNYIVASGMESK